MDQLRHLVSRLQSDHATETATAIARGTSVPGQVEAWCAAMARTIARGGTILACGNGGSAAEAQHLVGELVGRFRREREPMRAVALGADVPTLSAIANDYDYARAFSRQVGALGRPGDLLIGISTSGNSPSILNAMRTAREGGIVTVGLGGATAGGLADVSDLLVQAPSIVTSTIQEVHLFLIHLACNVLETYVHDEAFRAEFARAAEA